ncbi:hypothetical protein Poly24_05290 [Rosistilla carotiformis]|uniref:Uncharacterized protein n=1 Tax=Rosistilla carotiformis TaxID=2528017 RepID=A0A518JMW5_9BACT|nr:hypothetical protein Poly24_05290 [Rosistilla carotiformis]
MSESRIVCDTRAFRQALIVSRLVARHAFQLDLRQEAPLWRCVLRGIRSPRVSSLLSRLWLQSQSGNCRLCPACLRNARCSPLASAFGERTWFRSGRGRSRCEVWRMARIPLHLRHQSVCPSRERTKLPRWSVVACKHDGNRAMEGCDQRVLRVSGEPRCIGLEVRWKREPIARQPIGSPGATSHFRCPGANSRSRQMLCAERSGTLRASPGYWRCT